MNPEITIHPPLTIHRFCQSLVANHSGKWPPDEHTIVWEFVSFFRVDGLLKQEDLERFCQTLGVKVSVRELPKGLRGHNCEYRERREIVIGTVEGTAAILGSPEHTLFHELRELIEYEFRKMGYPVAVTASDLESRAEMFASAVRALALMNACKPMFEAVTNIKSGWGQFGAFLFLFVLIGAASFSYLMLPQWEDRLPK